MKRTIYSAFATLASAALVLGMVSSPAFAAGTSAAEEVALATVDIAGQITRVSDHPASEASTVRLFHVQGYGYLNVDFAAIQFGRTALGTITVRLQVPAGVDIGADLGSQFAALSTYSVAAGPLTALSIVSAATQDRTAARVNQTPATTAVHKIFAVVVTPFDVAGAAGTDSQSFTNIQADVDQANTYWRSQTENKVGFELTAVSEWYKSAYNCDVADPNNFVNLVTEAGAVAYSELGYRDAFNNHLVLIFPSGSACGGAAGTGTIGYSANSGGGLWVIGTQSPSEKQTLTHELGHNLSLGHANWLDCASSSPNPGFFGDTGCTEYAYGAAGDVMGYGESTSSGGSLSSAQAIRSNLWSSTSYAVAPQGTTVHTINALSTGSGKRAVVIEDAEGTNYFVEFRNNAGIDGSFSGVGCPAPVGGAGYCAPSAPSVEIQRLGLQNIGWYFKGLDGDDSQLIGRTVSGTRLVGYDVGQSFSAGGVTVTVTAITATQATVSVTRPSVTAQPGYVSVFCNLCTPGNDFYVGDTLTGMLDFEWVADSYVFQWYRSGAAISGATSQSYTLTTADLGKNMSVRVTSVTAGSPNYTDTDPYAGAPYVYGPVMQGQLVEGTAAINANALPFTATLASWFTPGTTFTYQWKRNGANIVGATLATYAPVAADNGALLSLAVTGKKLGYTNVTAVSAAKNYTLSSTGTLAISGAVQVGQQLVLNALTYSTVDGPSTATSFTYQWLRSGVVIAGATSDSYTLVAADLSKVITAKVVARASGYASNTATSAATTSVVRGDIAGDYGQPVVTQAPGTLQLSVALPGGSITEPGVAFAYQWYRDDVAIATGLAANYTLTAADYGKSIKARVVVTKPNYNSVALTSDAAAYSVTSTGSLAITGTVRVGEVLTAPVLDYATWQGSVSPSMTYQWLRNGVAIPLATSATYSAVAADYNTKLTVRVTASLSEFLPSVVLSSQTGLVAKGVLTGTVAAPTVTSNPVTMKLSAALTPGSIDQGGLVLAYQWYRNGVAVLYSTLSTYQLTAADFNKTISVRVIVAKTNYTSVTLTSLPVNYSVVPDGSLVPTFAGTVAQGQLLVVDARTFTAGGGPVVPTLAYVWLRDGLAIASATTDSYTLAAADLGKTISVKVTATYAGFLQSVSTSAGTQKVGVTAFADAAVPVGVSQAGMVLTAVPGVAAGPGVTLAKQWYRNGVAIYLATGPMFTLTAADYGKTIAVRVIASKATVTTVVGFSPAVNYSVVPTGALTITGTVRVGMLLTPTALSYSTNAGSVSPALTYQWYRNGVAIAGATGGTYTAVAADYATKLQVRVSAAVPGFVTSSVLSPLSVAVAKGVLLGDHAAPVVTKNGALVPLLTAAPAVGSFTDSIGLVPAYQWYRNGVAIAGATLPSFQLTAADYNKNVYVRLIMSKLNYTSVTLLSEFKNYSLVPDLLVPTFTGTVAQGQLLTADARTFTADGGPVTTDSLSYQWLRDGLAIASATTDSYTLAAADLGKTISVKVTATYAGFLQSVSTSAGTQKVGVTAFADAAVPVGVSQAGMVLTAVPGVAAGPGVTLAKQWYRNGVAIYLATGPMFTLTAADYGKTIAVRVIASKATVTTVVGFSPAVNYSVTPTGALTITGTVRVGMVLTPTSLSYATNAGPVSLTPTYQWLRNGIAITGATGGTYTTVAADFNTKIQVRVSAAVIGFLPSIVLSSPTVLVAKGVLTGTMAAPTVTSNPVTMKLSAALTPGSIDQTGLVLAYQWYRNGVAIYLATGSSYTLTSADYGKDIKVRVIVAKTNYTSVAQYSAPSVP